MSTCVLRHAAGRRRASASRLLAVALALAGLIGWRAVRDLLAAIPDSNDDFGLF